MVLAGKRIPALAHSALNCLGVPLTSLTTSLASRRSATARRFTLSPHPVHSPYCSSGSPHTTLPQLGHAPNAMRGPAGLTAVWIRRAMSVMS